MNELARQAIGVFDSGVGGLTVLREIRDLLPHEHLLYLADSAYAPYGDRSPAEITERCLQLLPFFERQGIKALVVACNTATSVAINELRAAVSIPVIGLEPAIKPAIAASRNKRIGVIGTTATLHSEKFTHLRARFADQAEFVLQACPGLVDYIEADTAASLAGRQLLNRYLEPLLQQEVDSLVLGCTHYVLIEDLIRDYMGPAISLHQSGAAVAQELRRRLLAKQSVRDGAGDGALQFWTTGSVSAAQDLFSRIWAAEVLPQHLPAEALSVAG